MVLEIRDVDVDLLDDEEGLPVINTSILEGDVKRDTLIVKGDVEKTLVPVRKKVE